MMKTKFLLFLGMAVLPLLHAEPANNSPQTNNAPAQAQLSASAAPLPESISPPPEPGKWQLFWINRVKEFIAENATLDPQQRYIVFVGDSLTQGFKLKTYFPDLPVLNRGIGSDGVCDFPFGRNVYRGVTRRMNESIYDCRPSYLIFMIGTNDVGMPGVPFDYLLGAYEYVLEQTRKRFPDVKIVCMTIPPTGLKYARHESLNPRILEWNALIKKYAATHGHRLIDLHSLLADKDGMLPGDMSSDGLHFNQTGYERWANAVRAILKEDGVIKEAK